MGKNLNRGNVLASACPSRQILQHLTAVGAHWCW